MRIAAFKSGVEVEHLANYLPLAIKLDQIEKIREAMPGPII